MVDHRYGVDSEYRDFVRVTESPLDPAALLDLVSDPTAGAVVSFLGTVRNHAPGKSGVSHLVYEAYVEVVEEKITGLVAEARSRWPLIKVAVEHRTGRVDVGGVSVAVVVSSAHRADAFEAARFLIDELKARAPIWKQEHWEGGSEWIEGS
ncbi:MAG: molybdenum cofactor biosynthesis protein MoaE [Acidimicrobiia bacterium]|nr:molybdenum cofactor biosynthesis protein MoaE [Acidimicrobiia bacterium]MBT8192987.1 molybdenum cofactor biosynthesis protein MoaE [Acidimicrobiia bacterium]MBT8246908.1 molybdenum cofactor biosynthesis protein MoaE [Acidimicrobiia bacterium]NNF88613.1 molybdenum cofactor biosynthesis protein MoaE [Acidimicrobiia bacterium]NNJ48147.1 molybdenum cofactor biosynthesis protein MoaE [Acidimicrobiia bacterium]